MHMTMGTTAGMSVTMIGPIAGAWPNNYGVWLDEWEELGLPDMCVFQYMCCVFI